MQTERTVGRAFGAVDVPSRQGAFCGGIDLDDRDSARIKVDADAREVVTITRPQIPAKLRENPQRLGRPEQPPDLVNQMRAPIIESAATVLGFVSPVGMPLARRRANAGRELTNAAFDVDD